VHLLRLYVTSCPASPEPYFRQAFHFYPPAVKHLFISQQKEVCRFKDEDHKILLPYLLICFYSCGQKQQKHKTNPEAVSLSNKIVPLVSHLDNPDSCRKALSFLNSATDIDSNCFLCYYNKLMFLYSLKEYDKAITTVKNSIRIHPYDQDLYSTGGILLRKVGDTLESGKYFKKSLAICNNVLDTMSISNESYFSLATTKAVDCLCWIRKEVPSSF
jgi:tetratricopeptide (TPR) repeat protein